MLVVLPAMERKIQNQLKRAAQKPGRAAPPASDDELGSNPFSKGPTGAPVDPYGKGPSRGNVDPFADGPSRGSAAPRKQNKPCDPFGDRAGCAK